MHEAWKGIEFEPGWTLGGFLCTTAGDLVGYSDMLYGSAWRPKPIDHTTPTRFAHGPGWDRLRVVRALIADGARIPHTVVDGVVHPDVRWLVDRSILHVPGVLSVPGVQGTYIVGQDPHIEAAATSVQEPPTESPWITLAHDLGNILVPLQAAIEGGHMDRARRCLARLWAANDEVRKQARAASEQATGKQAAAAAQVPAEGTHLSTFLDGLNAQALRDDPEVLALFNMRLEDASMDFPDLIFTGGRWVGAELDAFRDQQAQCKETFKALYGRIGRQDQSFNPQDPMGSPSGRIHREGPELQNFPLDALTGPAHCKHPERVHAGDPRREGT